MQNSPIIAMRSSRCPTQMQFYTPSSTNLFVRYLPREVDDNRLREIFSAFGKITSSMVMRDIYSGQSLGTAFVRYEEHEEALRAMRDAHGMPLLGKTVSVQWAKQQHDDTPAGQERLKMNKLFLRNVPLEVAEEDLVRLVSPYGSVRKVTMHNDTAPLIDATERRRIVFITFAEQGAAEAALLAVHNTCAFHQCRGIPLMGKLINDAVKSKRHRMNASRSHSIPTEFATNSPTNASARSSRIPVAPLNAADMMNATRKMSLESFSPSQVLQFISSSEESVTNTPSRSCGGLQWDVAAVMPSRASPAAVPRPIGCDSSDSSLPRSSSDVSYSSRFCHNPYSLLGEKTYV
ncbi:RNA recognition motif family protein [Leishmania donovani]|uniref:RNA binding protein, putative n=1 Tax=Leishmania donovani TaxID=5661 RepID=A0A3Q8IAX1_LEIDO|nr:RNA binding protein, putative [Leishmania donovani]TPP53311.1 RNA recognition motif family protein [Leishmania donovani]